jgi:hypothetical protein
MTCWKSAVSSASPWRQSVTSLGPPSPKSPGESARHQTRWKTRSTRTLPGPGEQHWFGGKALASIDLATIRLRTGALDAAIASLDPVFMLSAAQRITAVSTRLIPARAELAAPIFRGSAQARDLDERIEDFGRETVAAGLHSLPGGPG